MNRYYVQSQAGKLLTPRDLARLLTRGEVDSDTPVCEANQDEWKALSSIPEYPLLQRMAKLDSAVLRGEAVPVAESSVRVVSKKSSITVKGKSSRRASSKVVHTLTFWGLLMFGWNTAGWVSAGDAMWQDEMRKITGFAWSQSGFWLAWGISGLMALCLYRWLRLNIGRLVLIALPWAVLLVDLLQRPSVLHLTGLVAAFWLTRLLVGESCVKHSRTSVMES